MQHAPDAPYVFISYASADRDRVLPLVDALTRAGVPVWLDREGIHGGENYALEITDAIEHCAAFLLMTSPASLASRNCKQEIALGWEYARPYVPLLLETVAIPKEVKYWLTAAQWIEVLDTPEAVWLPAVLTALAPLGIVPTIPAHEEVRLAGREKELALLRERLAAAKEGRGGLVLIGGEAGLGKTTLAEATMREATSAGFTILEGHCFDLTETPPYGPWIDLFARYAPSPSSPPLPEAFARRGTVGAVPNQIALFVQAQDFLAALSGERPVAMLLDDLHWSDPASLDLLRFLSRSVANVPVLMLVTYRSDELTRRHPLYALLPQLAREASATRLDLGHLGDDAVRVLVDGRYHLPDADAARLVAYLQGRAEGNSLFVGELLRSLEEGGALARGEDAWHLGDLTQAGVPALLRQVIEGRVARLDDDAQQALAVAAVIGQEVPYAVWAAVSGIDEESLTETVERAAAARLMAETPDGAGARFVHALVREALYESLLPSRRRRLHRAAGEALAALPNPDADAVAHHFRVVGDARTASWLAKAGERARAAHAYVTAVERMQEALALLDKPEDAALAGSLALQIGVLLQASDTPQSIRYTEEAIRWAEQANDSVLAGMARCGLGGKLFWFKGEFARGLAVLRAGVAEMEALPREAWEHTAMPRWYISFMGGDRGAVADVHSSLDYVHGTLALTLAAIGACGEALSLVGGTLDISDAALANTMKVGALTVLADILDRPDVAQRMGGEFRSRARSEENWLTLSQTDTGFLSRTVLRYYADDLAYREAAASAAEAAAARAQALHLVAPFPVRAVRFRLDFLSGAWDVAQTSADVAQRFLGVHTATHVRLTLGTIARLRGKREDAWRYVREWSAAGAATEPGTRMLIQSIPFLHLGGLLALDAGDLDGARAWAEATDRWLAWSGAVLFLSEGEALWAQYYRQAGDLEQALAHAERALAHATEPRQPLALLAAHRLLGELDTEAGRYDTAEAHLSASLTLADACAAPYERALTLLAMAEMRDDTGARDAARMLLAEVERICVPLGAALALARTQTLSARLAQA